MAIHILSEDTINKIAAGEVIERPANVVKELAENSIDAGSRSIEIEITESGRKLIRVTDDGCGMLPEELSLAFTRHATSKISGFDDLSKILTMGFRGEALPSIASVSNVLVQSQAKGADAGMELRISGGKVKGKKEWAGKPGTNIEVSGLFFNTPARLKFLKSGATEKHNILSHAEQLALARPEISFRVISDGRQALNTPQTKKPVERIFDVLGDGFASSLVPFEITHPKIKLSGFATPTEKNQPNRNFQFLFVNRRPVQISKVIFRAIYDAYSENLPKGRHPGILLYMEIDPSEIDVNIHPAKREIRIAKENDLYDIIYRSIKTALNRPVQVRLTQFETPESSVQPAFVKEAPATYTAEELILRNRTAAGKPAAPFISADFEAGKTAGNAFQVFGSYLVAQKGDELIIIDQHAAAERIRYERYSDEARNDKVQVQQMLIPETLDMPASLSALLKENIGLLKETGWEIEEFGSKTFRITGVPAVLGAGLEIINVIKGVLESLAEETKLTEAEKKEKIIRSACRKSIKAGDRVSRQEMDRLIDDLFKCAAPYTCPHGRPTVFKLSRKQLEKYFGRI
ncbi:MAG: DNA mismatch repair endonuclease MutL [Elusimicrobiota bacterium]